MRLYVYRVGQAPAWTIYFKSISRPIIDVTS